MTHLATLPLTRPALSARVGEAGLLTAALLLLFVVTLPLSRFGYNLTDETINHHFGQRIVQGQVPYRDFHYQVGPWTPLWDALWQAVLGPSYRSSLIAAFAVQAVSVVALYGMMRQRLGAVSVVIALGCVLAWPVLAHKSYADAAMFTLLAAWAAMAQRWAWCGVLMGMLMLTRQSEGVVTLLAVAGVLAWRRDRAAWPLLMGLMVTLTVAGAALAVCGALKPMIQQVFLDAGEKKPHGAMAMLIDAISGGTAVSGRMSLLVFNGLAMGLVVSLWRHRGWLLMVAAIGAVGLQAMGMRQSAGWFFLWQDLPRMVLLLALILWLRSGAQRQTMSHGLSLAIAFGSFAGLQVSWLGRDHISPIVMPMMLAMTWPMTQREPWRSVMSGAGFLLLAAALLHAVTRWPNTLAYQPAAMGQQVPHEKAHLLDALRQHVQPGDTLFIYGGAAPLYSLLHAVNPTPIDMIYPDYVSRRDVDQIITTLHRQPPHWLITVWGPTFLPEHGSINPMQLPASAGPQAFGFNGAAMAPLHRAMHELLIHYELVFDASTLAMPTPHGLDGDRIGTLHLYRLKPETPPRAAGESSRPAPAHAP